VPVTIDNQTVIRVNRDTLHWFSVFDLDAGCRQAPYVDAGR
jgi:hypothetical protein